MTSISTPQKAMCEISTPEMLWHGGGSGGKTDPVYSIDFLGNSLIATSGIDDNQPAKGSVRLWRMADSRVTFLHEFNDHQSVVNAARFSPCGRMLATASDRLVIVYELTSVSEAADNCWLEISENLQNSAGPPFTRIWYNLDLAEIYDLQWAPDSAYFVAGAINCKGQVVRIKTKETTTLVGHTSYVQGVAWDPLNKMVATQSADNSVKVHQLKTGANGVRLAAQGHTVVRTMSAIESDATAVIDSENAAKPRSLYADSVLVASFFRRLCFTPDGSLLITPTGVLKPSLLKAMSPDLAGKSTSSGVFATHVFHRSNLSVPAVSLGGLDEPSVAVRCCPRLFSRAPQQHSAPAQGFSGDYRVVFAVATTSCVLIYDTQHLSAPLMKISNLHLATINDVAWSADASQLVVCSTDGYVSIIRFAPEALGSQLPLAQVPLAVRRALPFIYGYVPEAIESLTIAPCSKSDEAASSPSKKRATTTTTTTAVTVVKPSHTDTAIVSAPDDPNGPKKKKRITPTVVAQQQQAGHAPAQIIVMMEQ